MGEKFRISNVANLENLGVCEDVLFRTPAQRKGTW
jgi:hypothetical protein